MAATEPPQLLSVRATPAANAAVAFVHGFTGSAGKTWGSFPDFLVADPRLAGWDVYSLGYKTDLRIDIPGVWKAKPDLEKLALQLRTSAGLGVLKKYRVLSFVAHSMGGLVVQRALLDDPDLVARTRHVVLFGTPSGGLKKAGLLGRLNRQVGGMSARGPFIRELRSGWLERFGEAPPFAFLAAAGDQDEFVPSSSSLGPFPDAQQAVVYGGHLEIVKPETPHDLSVQVLTGILAEDGAPAGPWNSARKAVERKDFEAAIKQLWPHRAELDDRNLVSLALALESVGRTTDAVETLEEHAASGHGGTDPLGVLGGRIKRRWLAEGRRADGERALELYRLGLERSAAAEDHEQAFYHAINVAFLELAFARDRRAARQLAEQALGHCDRHAAAAASETLWSLATRGEAQLLLGRDAEALAAYAAAIAREPSPRELDSMFVQATHLTEILERKATQKRLEALFRGPVEPVAETAAGREDRP